MIEIIEFLKATKDIGIVAGLCVFGAYYIFKIHLPTLITSCEKREREIVSAFEKAIEKIESERKDALSEQRQAHLTAINSVILSFEKQIDGMRQQYEKQLSILMDILKIKEIE